MRLPQECAFLRIIAYANMLYSGFAQQPRLQTGSEKQPVRTIHVAGHQNPEQRAEGQAPSPERSAARASWNGAVIAESDRYEVVEGNVYFPPDSVDQQYLRDSETVTFCSWKGQARYKTIAVDGKENPDAAWYYPEPKSAAENIAGYFAFWHGVSVTSEET